MTVNNRPALPCRVLDVLLLVALSATALAVVEPVSKSLLLRTLGVGGVDQETVIKVVRARGVDFALTPEIESELRQVGAGDALIQAVRESSPASSASSATPPAAPTDIRRAEPAPARASSPGAPLEKDQITLALESGASQQRLASMAEQRGLAFDFTSDIGRELKAAGAGAELIAALAVARGLDPPDAAPVSSTPPDAANLPPEGFIPLPLARATDYDPYAQQGRLDLRMFVDGASEIRVRGDRVIHTSLQARPGRNAGSEFTQPLPQKPLASLDIKQKDGRGKWAPIQQPSAENGYELVVRIYDPKGGEDRYHLRITWTH